MKSIIFALLTIVSLSAQAKKSPDSITNFLTVNEFIARGGRPTLEQVALLEQKAFKSVINLQGGDTAVSWFEKGEKLADIQREGAEVLAHNMFYHSLPLSSLKPVDSVEAQSIAEALEIMNDPTQQPVFIHCAHGKDRTGLVVALYRVIYQGWELQTAYAEMVAQGHDDLHRILTFSLDRYLLNYDFASYIQNIIVTKNLAR